MNEGLFLLLPNLSEHQKGQMMPKKELYYYAAARQQFRMNGKRKVTAFCEAARARYWNCLVENEVYDALANAAKFTIGSSRVCRRLPRHYPTIRFILIRSEPSSVIKPARQLGNLSNNLFSDSLST